MNRVVPAPPPTVATLFQAALGAHQAGRLREAETVYRQLLSIDPRQADAWHLLGIVQHQQGRSAAAEVHIRQALALREDAAFLVNLGVVLVEMRKLSDAEAAYRHALALKPDSAEACNNLALLLKETRRRSEAEAIYRRALTLKPDIAKTHYNLGLLLQETRRLPEAEAAFRRALALQPDDAETHNDLGNLLRETGRPIEAEAAYRRTLDLKPDHAAAHFNLGALLQDVGRPGEAEAAYFQALKLKPDFAAVHNNLGNLRRTSHQLPEAEAAYRRALALKPEYAQAHYNLGQLLRETGRLGEAEAAYRRALELQPEDAAVRNDLANLFRHSGRLAEAETAYRQALELSPDFVEAFYNLGNLLQEDGRLGEAEAMYQHALELQPDHAQTQYNLSLLLLAQGRYDEAWPRYESRYRCDHGALIGGIPDLPYPPWRGESLVGKSLAIWSEQGFGDYIQFARYAPLLKARGVSRLTVVCAPPLKALFETLAGVDQVTVPSLVPAHDFWCFFASAPLHFASTLSDLPAALPYLHATPARAARWRDRLPAAGRKVGLVWKGRASHRNDAHRSLPGLKVLAPLWAAPGVRFISLQKGQGEDEAAAPPAGLAIVPLGSDIEDFADTAAIIAQLDLLISVDTAVAHLAGALGKPCWVLLPAIGTDWRWLRDRTDSPWYPDVMRLFRQSTPNDWSATVGELAAALAAWAVGADADLQGESCAPGSGRG